MRVLWFTNGPCGAIKKLTGNEITGGGWLYALSQALKIHTEIELHIAFYWKCEMASFEYEGITYHPILRNGSGSKIGRYIYRLKQQFQKNVDDLEIERCLKVYRNINPDIVHFHGSEENFGHIAQHIDNIKCVLSIQGMLAPYYYKLYSGIQKYDVLRSEPLLSKLILDGYDAQAKRLKNRAQMEIECLKAIPNILGRTNWDRDCTIAINPERRYFTCNEILRAEFLNSQWTKRNKNQRIVLCTTVSYGLYKGLEMVYETANLLTHANINFEWNVIGIANGDKYASLVQRVTSINPHNVHINLMGRKTASQMIDIFRCSDCFVQVSHIENSPNSLCEAMVLGMPIIASNAGGTSSLLEDGKDGILVQDGDPYRLAGAIINMKNNFEQAVMMGKIAREKALIRHNPQNVIHELLTAYRVICNKTSTL